MHYLTEEEMVRAIISTLTDEDIGAIRSMEKKDMIQYHHGVGTFIRNKFRLWDEENPLTGKGGEISHPDEISMRVLNGVWEEVNVFWEEVKK